MWLLIRSAAGPRNAADGCGGNGGGSGGDDCDRAFADLVCARPDLVVCCSRQALTAQCGVWDWRCRRRVRPCAEACGLAAQEEKPRRIACRGFIGGQFSREGKKGAEEGCLSPGAAVSADAAAVY